MTGSNAVEAARPQRRVGTFTLGLSLLATGAALLAAMFYPAISPERLLQASPVILILLGAEILLALRKDSRIKYDWLGMLLCVLLVGASLSMYAAAWYVSQDFSAQSIITRRYADDTSYSMAFNSYSGYDSHILHLESGDTLRAAFTFTGGSMDVEISDLEGNVLAEDTICPDSSERLVEIPATGDYWVQVDGDYATGSFLIGTIALEESA